MVCSILAKFKALVRGKFFQLSQKSQEWGQATILELFSPQSVKILAILILFKSNFFKDFPNWKYVSKLNPSKKASGFFYRPAENFPYTRKSEHRLNDEEKAIIVEIFKNLNLSSAKLFETLNTKFAFETIIRIERDKIVLNKGGLILDLNRIKAVKDIVLNFSGLVEKHPIMRTPER
nr:hypothetical protein [uncultured Desulfobacter sp.]